MNVFTDKRDWQCFVVMCDVRVQVESLREEWLVFVGIGVVVAYMIAMICNRHDKRCDIGVRE